MLASTIMRILKRTFEIESCGKTAGHVYVHAGVRALLVQEGLELCQSAGLEMDRPVITHIHGMEIHTLPDNILRPGIVGFCTENAL